MLVLGSKSRARSSRAALRIGYRFDTRNILDASCTAAQNIEMPIRIRDAAREDCAAMCDIYNHYVRTSTCTLALVEETLEERLRWFDSHRRGQPILVADDAGEIAAWASLSSYHPRGGYARTVENSIYVRHDRRGAGLGRALVEALIARAKEHRYHTMIASVSADQDASIGLHTRLGFVPVAHCREVGFKFDLFVDVVLLQLMLSEPDRGAAPAY
jgi:L-amino acid N-acyltransferase